MLKETLAISMSYARQPVRHSICRICGQIEHGSGSSAVFDQVLRGRTPEKIVKERFVLRKGDPYGYAGENRVKSVLNSGCHHLHQLRVFSVYFVSRRRTGAGKAYPIVVHGDPPVKGHSLLTATCLQAPPCGQGRGTSKRREVTEKKEGR